MKAKLSSLVATAVLSSCSTVANKGSTNLADFKEGDTIMVEEVYPAWPTLDKKPDGSWV